MELHSLAHPTFTPDAVSGRLSGRYVLVADCVLYDVERKICLTPLRPIDFAFTEYQRQLRLPDFQATIESCVTAVAKESVNLPIILTPFAANYFHFSLEFVSAIRHVPKDAIGVGVLSNLVVYPYQRDLLASCLEGRQLFILDGSELHVDPIIGMDFFSLAAVDFIRDRVAAFADPGADVVYIERRHSITRQPPGGGLAETAEFLALLGDHQARRVSFGNGQMSLFDQITQLDGAAVILTTHGAAMTNCLYLRPGVTIIEIADPAFAQRTMFEQLSRHIGLDYHRLVCPVIDSENRLVLSSGMLAELRALIAQSRRLSLPSGGTKL